MTDLLKIYGPIAAFVIVGFVVAYQFVDPAPPRRLTIATGGPTGAYHAFGKRYRKILGRDGIAVTLVNTAGSVENLSLLDRSIADDAARPRIDIAFVQSGVGAPAQSPALVSLASLYFEPLWVLVRTDRPSRRLTELAGRRLAIGVEGSGTRHVTRRLLAANGIADGDSHGTRTIDLGAAAAAEALLAGEVDAAFFVTAKRNPVLAELLASPAIRLMSFDRAAAYESRFRYLANVVLPEGAVDLAGNVPDAAVQLLSPVATLVARPDLHPALIDLVLRTATEIHGAAGLFEAAGAFPAVHGLDFPLSPEAERYFQSGLRFLRRTLPFWAATLVERLWVMVLPIITLLIPLLRIAPPTYRWQVRRRIVRWYRDLREIEARLQQPGETDQATARREARAALDRMQDEVGRINVPITYAEHLYNLRLHIDFVRRRSAAD